MKLNIIIRRYYLIYLLYSFVDESIQIIFFNIKINENVYKIAKKKYKAIIKDKKKQF